MGFSVLLCEEVVNQFFGQICNLTENHQKLSIKNFGIFSINNKKARIGRNPKTKEEFTIIARKKIQFSPAQYLKNAINVSEDMK